MSTKIIKTSMLPKQEADPDSVLNFYRKAIALRKSLSCVRYGEYREYQKLSGKHSVSPWTTGSRKSGCLLLFAKDIAPCRCAEGLPSGGGRIDSVQSPQAAGRLLAALRMPGVSLEITTAGGSLSIARTLIAVSSGHTRGIMAALMQPCAGGI